MVKENSPSLGMYHRQWNKHCYHVNSIVQVIRITKEYCEDVHTYIYSCRSDSVRKNNINIKTTQNTQRISAILCYGQRHKSELVECDRESEQLKVIIIS